MKMSIANMGRVLARIHEIEGKIYPSTQMLAEPQEPFVEVLEEVMGTPYDDDGAMAPPVSASVAERLAHWEPSLQELCQKAVDQLAYDEFIHSLVQPTVIGVLEMYPLSGNAILELNSNLTFSIIDRLLGGKGEPLRKPRDLTDIERTVVERIMMKILEHLEESWSTVVDIRFRFEGMESNPFFVQVCPGTDMVLLVTMQIQIGEVQGIMNFCIPYFVIEPLIDKLSSQQWFSSTSRKGGEGVRETLVERLNEVSVPLALELGHSVINLGDVLQVQTGDVIRLDGTTKDPLGLRVGNRVKFHCVPGLINKNYAAQVTEVLREELPPPGEGE